jgi:hypothetical protein
MLLGHCNCVETVAPDPARLQISKEKKSVRVGLTTCVGLLGKTYRKSSTKIPNFDLALLN